MKTLSHRRVLQLGVLLMALLLGPAETRPASATQSLPKTVGGVVTWTGAAGDSRWSNPANWDGGVVPGSVDTVRFAGDSPDALVDPSFAGTVAGLMLDEGYAGTVTLARELVVTGDMRIESGTLEGGSAALTIGGKASVRGGVLTTPSNSMSVTTLDIDSPGLVRMGAHGKLNLTGDGTPLTGSGLLDTTTNAPNSVEYTGHAQSDLTAAGPAVVFHALANAPIGRQPGSKPAMANGASPLAPATFAEVGSLTLLRGEDALTSAAIDTSNGFGYFGTGSNIGPSGVIVKVRLSDLTHVGAVTLGEGEKGFTAAVIDTAKGFGYFGTNTYPGIVVKVRLSDFTRDAALTLNPGENRLTSAVIDSASGFAYFGTNTGAYDTPTARVIKVRLSDFTRVTALTLQTGESGLTSAAIDTTTGVAYFGGRTGDVGMGTQSGLVLKVRLSDFSRAGSLTLSASENDLTSAVIDTGHGFVYFGTNSYPNPGIVVKVRLLDFSQVAALTLNAGEISLRSAAIDTVSGFAYFGTGTGPGIVVKVRLSDFTRVGALTLPTGEDWLTSAVIDTADGYAYFGTSTAPGIVEKVRLSDFSHAAALSLNAAEPVCSAVIDAANGFAYFGTDSRVVVKVRLSDFTRVGALMLNPGESGLCSAVMDTENGFAYFATRPRDGSNATIVKVRLSDFTRADALTLNEGTFVGAAVIDTPDGFAYFATGTNSPLASDTIVKVRLSDFTRVGALTLMSGDFFMRSAVIDSASGFAYFGNSGMCPGAVVKVRLSDFSRADRLTLTGLECILESAVIDAPSGFAYFGTAGGSTGSVIKVRLSDFTRVGALTLNPGEGELTAAVVDAMNGFAYFGTFSYPGKVVKVRLSDFSRDGALTLNPGENRLASAVIDTDHGFAYFGTSTDPGIVAKVKVGFDNLILTDSANVTAMTGDALTYMLSIQNDSPDTATGLTLTDTLPVSVTFVSATPGPTTCNLSGGQVVCNLGPLAAGVNTQVTILVNVSSSARGIITNTASISASEPRFSAPKTATLTTLINPLQVYLPWANR